ncbi:uncharacterized protein [Clytia hemisphaerica]|uniref:uncharacterized protein n=1 Tax=Clytia hemisphaerica TaxID=252671 RepID=UPI0034D5DA15
MSNYTVYNNIYNKKQSPCKKHYEELGKKVIRPDFMSALQLKCYKKEDDCSKPFSNIALSIDEAYVEAKKIDMSNIFKDQMSCDPMQQADEDINRLRFKDQYVINNGTIIVKSSKAEIVLAGNGRFNPSSTQPQLLNESWRSSPGNENKDLLFHDEIEPASNFTIPKIATENTYQNDRKSSASEHSEEIEPGGDIEITSSEPPGDNQQIWTNSIEMKEKTSSTSPMQIDQVVKTAVEHSSDQEMPTASGSPDQSKVATDESMQSREDDEDHEDPHHDNAAGGGDDGGDEGNAPREGPPSTTQEILDAFQTQMCAQLTDQENGFLEHFLHAHRCSKLVNDRPENFDECFLTNCNNPDSMVEYCQKILGMTPLKDDQNYEMISKILMHHSKFCRIPFYCNMLLCKYYSDISKQLNLDSNIPCIRGRNQYEVVLSNSPNNERMIEGVDFFILYANLCGQGAFGSVYDGCFQRTGEGPNHVAVKIIKIDEEKKAEKIALARSLQCIRRLGAHPNLLLPKWIMKCDYHYLQIMDYADTDLLSHLDTFHRHINHPDTNLQVAKDVLIIRFFCFHFHQMAKAIQYLHSLDMVHGDIKPQNFVLMNNLMTVKLIDFDFLKEENVRQKCGSPGYAAPEVSQHNTVNKASDVYSLGRCIIPMVLGDQNVLVNDHFTRERLTEMLMKMNEMFGIYRDIAGLFFNTTEVTILMLTYFFEL